MLCQDPEKLDKGKDKFLRYHKRNKCFIISLMLDLILLSPSNVFLFQVNFNMSLLTFPFSSNPPVTMILFPSFTEQWP